MSSSSSRSATSEKKKVVGCPQCGAPVAWDPANPFRPFCSERCKMIDLGAWATESYRIPIQEENESLEDEEQGGGARN
jgi:endogenous inhibitor of DNA gyrase (YacG/DUF329 family)